MKKHFILTIFLFSISSFLFGQTNDNHLEEIKCQKEWKYLDFPNELSGTVIFYDQPFFLCGKLSNASVALIRTNMNDTVRVLAVCETKEYFNSSNKFKQGDKVFVTSSPIPHLRIDFIPTDPKTCLLLTTYFGSIQTSK